MALVMIANSSAAQTRATSSAASTSPAALLVVLLLSALFLLFRRNAKMKRATSAAEAGDGEKVIRCRLPPGSMGWPYIGETFQLYSNNNPNSFFEEKQRRYGAVFKTHILGCPCVMVSSPEAARFVLVTKAHLFKPTFPASKERMLGPRAIFFQGPGDYHARLRRVVLRAFMPEAIRPKVPGIEELALRSLSSWDGRLINAYQEMKTYALNVALLSIFEEEQEQSCIEELKQCYCTLEKGYNSMPVNVPGTLFHKAIKARRQLGFLVARIISSRRRSEVAAPTSFAHASDLLASFMEAKEALTDDQIADNVIGVIFAARDTTASVLAWILKYLAENPTILQVVTEEQEVIRKRKIAGDTLNWADTRSMPVTCRVIQETMRVASILSFTFREAVEDVEYEGWKVLPLFRNIHHSPDNFPDPEKFDPSRFKLPPKPNTYIPFGNGTHACPGNELAKLEMLVLLHHLTTKYRWTLSGSKNGIQFGPFALPIDGLPVKIERSQMK